MDEKTKPAFLTEAVADLAIAVAVDDVMQSVYIRHMFKRVHCHIVVQCLVDGEPMTVYEGGHGDPEEWNHNYTAIARNKAALLWRGHDGRTDAMPHLLCVGDTPYWGGVYRDGIVVACSGVQPWFDRMIAGIVADLCIGLAYDAWMVSEVRKDGHAFLTDES